MRTPVAAAVARRVSMNTSIAVCPTEFEEQAKQTVSLACALCEIRVMARKGLPSLELRALSAAVVSLEKSERVGVVHSFICSLENGKKQPSLKMILKLGAALGVRPGELVDTAAERESAKG